MGAAAHVPRSRALRVRDQDEEVRSVNQTFTFMKGGDFRFLRWVEIEGLPYAYGSAPKPRIVVLLRSRRGSTVRRDQGVPQVAGADRRRRARRARGLPKHAAGTPDRDRRRRRNRVRPGEHGPGPARLSADYAAGATSIVYVGSDPGFGAGPGIAYIGNETIRYGSHNAGTKTLSSVTAGASARSRARGGAAFRSRSSPTRSRSAGSGITSAPTTT